MELLSPSMIKFFGVEKERGTKDLLNYNLNKLRYLGLWKWDMPHWKSYRIFAFITIIVMIIFVVMQIIDVYMNFSDIDRLTKLLITTVYSILLVCKNSYLLLTTNEAHDLIDMLQNRFFTYERPPTSQQTEILNKYAARAKLYTIIRSNMALSIFIIWTLLPIKDMLEEYAEQEFQENNDESSNNKSFTFQLPFTAFSPLDAEHDFLSFLLTFAFQIYCGLAVFIGMPAWDMLFVSIFIHTSGHFKALQHTLIHIHDEVTQMYKMNTDSGQLSTVSEFLLCDGTGNDNENQIKQNHLSHLFIQDDTEGIKFQGDRKIMYDMVDEKMLLLLNNCIQHHQHILSFMEKLEALLKPVMLMQLMASVIAFCVIGFQMSVIPIHTESVKFIKLSVSLVSALVEQGMFYWFGDELLFESGQTLDAAYHCMWHNTSKKFNQHLFLLMERSKRKVKLTAGGFSCLTLESFASVIQSSYSYFTMLKAVHDEDGED